MAIDYTGTNAGLFVRLGKLINIGAEERSAQNTLVTHIEEAMGKYTATSIDRIEYLGTLAGDKETLANNAGLDVQSAVKEAIEKTIVEQVNLQLDPPLQPTKTIDIALRRLSEDMVAQSQAIATTFILFSDVTNASTAFDGTIVMGENGKYAQGGIKGVSAASNDTALAETLRARCIQDAKDGRLIAGNERFEVSGENAVERLDRRWPDGSGCRLQLHATCSDIDSSSATGQNMLTNSGFERRNATPFPLDWTAGTGTIGTDLTSSTTPARGSYSLKFTGDGSAERSVYQIMGQGPRARIRSNTCYAIVAWLRADVAQINSGIVQFGLTDSAGTFLTGCTVSRDMSAVPSFTTVWLPLKGSFTTPLNLPAEVRFYIRTTAGGSALPNGAQLLIDDVVLAPVNVLYPGGPGCIIVPGTANFELADEMAVEVTRTVADWQLELDRYLDLASKDIRLPTASGTNVTIAKTLIA